MPKSEEAPVLVDAFLGGASVSLFGKARGYRVISNDIAYRSSIVGKALIENDYVTLTPDDVTRLFVEDGYGRSIVAAEADRSLQGIL
jgi:adenine-specific DNA methylase